MAVVVACYLLLRFCVVVVVLCRCCVVVACYLLLRFCVSLLVFLVGACEVCGCCCSRS